MFKSTSTGKKEEKSERGNDNTSTGGDSKWEREENICWTNGS